MAGFNFHSLPFPLPRLAEGRGEEEEKEGRMTRGGGGGGRVLHCGRERMFSVSLRRLWPAALRRDTLSTFLWFPKLPSHETERRAISFQGIARCRGRRRGTGPRGPFPTRSAPRLSRCPEEATNRAPKTPRGVSREDPLPLIDQAGAYPGNCFKKLEQSPGPRPPPHPASAPASAPLGHWRR